MSHDKHDLKDETQIDGEDSSDLYESHHAHGIQTKEERHAWETLVQIITMEKFLEILNVGYDTGEIWLLRAKWGIQCPECIFLTV